MPFNPNRKLRVSMGLNVWPAKHLSDAIRKHAKESGKSLTRLVEESLAYTYGLPVDQSFTPSGKYPSHKPQNHLLNERES